MHVIIIAANNPLHTNICGSSGVIGIHLIVVAIESKRILIDWCC